MDLKKIKNKLMWENKNITAMIQIKISCPVFYTGDRSNRKLN